MVSLTAYLWACSVGTLLFLRLATLVFLLGEGFELRDERSSVRRRQDQIESLNPKGKEQMLWRN